MFVYDALSEEEAMSERFSLLKEGQYEAVVVASSDTTSSKGSPMMDMTLSVYDENGKTHDIRDFLVFTKPMMWKVVHFADSAGCLQRYKEGTFCSEVAIDKRVVVKVTIEKGGEIPIDKLNGKPVGTRYFDKNKIEDYVRKEEQKPLTKEEDPFAGDDVNF